MDAVELVKVNDFSDKLLNDLNNIISKKYESSKDNNFSNNNQKENIILNDDEVKKLEKELNNSAASLNFDLKFQIHQDTGKIMVKVIDKKTHKLIKEIPPESFLNFLEKFDEMLGVLFDKNS